METASFNWKLAERPFRVTEIRNEMPVTAEPCKNEPPLSGATEPNGFCSIPFRTSRTHSAQWNGSGPRHCISVNY
ncbi:unnamed protein product [Auanema sp. JU1783]|nr:unnamed protein product [Auanema sp. JU1783]